MYVTSLRLHGAAVSKVFLSGECPMKKFLTLTALIAGVSFSQFAVAGEDNKTAEKKAKAEVEVRTVDITVGPDGKIEVKKPKVEKTPSSDLKLETLGIGKVFVIGPDGEGDVKEFEGKIPKEILDKLPEELRKAIQKEPSSRRAFGKMKLVIEMDGKRQEFESDLGGLGDLEGLPFDIFDEILDKAKDKLPKDQLPPEVIQALGNARQVMKTEGKKHADPAADSNDLSAKLDKILDRLDRLEKDVKELKAKADK
jgi:hypothetical protein